MELHEQSAVELAALVHTGAASPLEIVEHFLDRVDTYSERLGAFVTITGDRAIDAARAAQRLRESGDPPPPLVGVATAVKDLVATAGVTTTYGSAAFADHVPRHDDHVVVRLRDAGLISLGKTNTPELGIPCYTEPDVAPPARTPWDLQRSASGSSGGAAAAVAGRLLPVAHGNDGGGSVRTPASVCGIVGFKPSRGRISNGPRGGDAAGLACHGVLARTVADVAALLDVLSGPFPGDPWWAPPAELRFARAASADMRRLRIGRYCEPVLAETALDAQVRAAYDDATALLVELGHDVEDIPRPFDSRLVEHFEVLWSTGPAAVAVPPEREHLLRPLTRWMRERGRQYSAVDLLAALAAVREAAREAVVATVAYDAVLTPTLAALPRRVGEIRDDGDPHADFAAQKRFSPFCAPYNVTGQPAASLPLSWSEEGLPIGIQLVGRPGADVSLIALCAQVERARPWRDRRPELS